jgi:heme/copper-type cytochrome/quinol oxidase subunit 2
MKWRDEKEVTTVDLAADLGYGIPWLIQVLTIAIIAVTGFFLYVALSTRSEHKVLGGFDNVKYRLHKYHAERYWAIFVAGMLIWLWFLGYSWMPSVAFSAAKDDQNVHIVKIEARQWAWSLEDGGTGEQVNASHDSATATGQLRVKAGETVKFVARSLDVNHGFAILSSDKSMDSPMMQMQVVPGHDNVFYFTFDKPGTYTIRCLEYCGWNHPFMVSQITITAA